MTLKQVICILEPLMRERSRVKENCMMPEVMKFMKVNLRMIRNQTKATYSRGMVMYSKVILETISWREISKESVKNFLRVKSTRYSTNASTEILILFQLIIKMSSKYRIVLKRPKEIRSLLRLIGSS